MVLRLSREAVHTDSTLIVFVLCGPVRDVSQFLSSQWVIHGGLYVGQGPVPMLVRPLPPQVPIEKTLVVFKHPSATRAILRVSPPSRYRHSKWIK